MTLHRAFVSTNLLDSASIGTAFDLSEDVAHRLIKILRLTTDEQVELFDGKGVLVRGRLVALGKSQILVETIERKSIQGVRLTLVQALVKQDKLEEVVQHGTELGVHQFIFFSAQRSIVKVTERTSSQFQRLEKIAIDASRQCERSDVPDVIGPLTFEKLLTQIVKPKILVFLGEPREAISLAKVLSEADQSEVDEVILIVGPEGGLDDSEIHALLRIGAKAVRYAPYVLRTQTAGLVGMSIIQSFFK